MWAGTACERLQPAPCMSEIVSSQECEFLVNLYVGVVKSPPGTDLMGPFEESELRGGRCGGASA